MYKKIIDSFNRHTHNEPILDRFSYRVISIPFVLAFAKLNITPNIVSFVSLVFGIVSAYYFSVSNILLALMFLYARFLFDNIDGLLAEYTGTKSSLGAFLDPFFDRIADFAIFAGIALMPTTHTGLPAALYLFIMWSFVSFFSNYIELQRKNIQSDIEGALNMSKSFAKKYFMVVYKYIGWDTLLTSIIFTIFALCGYVQYTIIPFLIFSTIQAAVQLRGIINQLK